MADELFLRRMRTTCGHLQAVIRMAETGEPCEHVLHQLEAVIGALKAAEHTFIQNEITRLVLAARESACQDARSEALEQLLTLYTFLARA